MKYRKPSLTILGDSVQTVRFEPKTGSQLEFDDNRPIWTVDPAYDLDE